MSDCPYLDKLEGPHWVNHHDDCQKVGIIFKKGSQYLYLGVDLFGSLEGLHLRLHKVFFSAEEMAKEIISGFAGWNFQTDFPRKFRDGSGESKAVSETLARNAVPFHAVSTTWSPFPLVPFPCNLKIPM